MESFRRASASVSSLMLVFGPGTWLTQDLPERGVTNQYAYGKGASSRRARMRGRRLAARTAGHARLAGAACAPLSPRRLLFSSATRRPTPNTRPPLHVIVILLHISTVAARTCTVCSIDVFLINSFPQAERICLGCRISTVNTRVTPQHRGDARNVGQRTQESQMVHAYRSSRCQAPTIHFSRHP